MIILWKSMSVLPTEMIVKDKMSKKGGGGGEPGKIFCK
jgi:hypothetical protein